jgi:hypothetical protein
VTLDPNFFGNLRADSRPKAGSFLKADCDVATMPEPQSFFPVRGERFPHRCVHAYLGHDVGMIAKQDDIAFSIDP